MNADVVNEIFKRRPARDFLRLYPSDKWREIIPDVFEIGVLNLKNSFGTFKFTKIDLNNILEELRNYNPSQDNVVEVEYDKNDITNNYINKSNNRNNNKNNFNNNNNNFNNNNNDTYYEDNNEENEEDNNDNNDVDYNNGSISNNENNFDNNNSIASFNNNKNFNNNINNNNLNQIKSNYKNSNNNSNNSNYKKSKKEDIKEATANAEVFIPDMRKINNNANYNRPKIAYNATMEEIKVKNIENKRNLGYTESKIKYQIMNDKMNHQAKKKRKISDNENTENDGSFSFKKNNNNNKKENVKEKNTNKNYVINFDKHLNPQKPIEVPKRFDKYNQNNFNNIGNNQMGNINYNLNSNSLENDDESNLKDYNEENIFKSFHNNSNDNNNEEYNDQVSFGEKINNYKLDSLNFPKYEYNRGFNINNN